MYILTKERTLMTNRHIDHVIMCSIYVICNKVNKIKNNTPAFKDIIREYRTISENQRQISPIEICRVLWQVPLDDNQQPGDIVKFYNIVFIPAVKTYILQLPSTPASNLPFQVATIMSPARKRLPSKGNIFLSPMRKLNPSTPSASNGTPRTKSVYAFGEHHSAKVDVNEKTETPKSEEKKRPLKRPLFTDDADEPPSKKQKNEDKEEDSSSDE